MSTITTRDGTESFYKDWGAEQPVVFAGERLVVSGRVSAGLFVILAGELAQLSGRPDPMSLTGGRPCRASS